MSESIDSIELKALGKRYPGLYFEDRQERRVPTREACKFLRFQAVKHDFVNDCVHLVAHAESVSRLADILAQRNRAQ